MVGFLEALVKLRFIYYSINTFITRIRGLINHNVTTIFEKKNYMQVIDIWTKRIERINKRKVLVEGEQTLGSSSSLP